jgi:serine O-acetyltransferase
MDKSFLHHIYNRQQKKQAVPSNEAVADWAFNLICILFPELSYYSFQSLGDVEEELMRLEKQLADILNATKACHICNNDRVAHSFFKELPELYRVLSTDVFSIVNGDPAAKSEFEVIRCYPGFYAICFYRIAHKLWKLDVPLIPRVLTEFAHSKTGIDIHPGAEIDEYLFIDHGTGIVIGETAKIGKHVKIYQGVTLGALSVNKSMANQKRHPTVEDHVVLYSGATILGGETVIGHHSIIGGNVWLTNSIPPGTLVYHNPEVTVVEGKMIDQLMD